MALPAKWRIIVVVMVKPMMMMQPSEHRGKGDEMLFIFKLPYSYINIFISIILFQYLHVVCPPPQHLFHSPLPNSPLPSDIYICPPLHSRCKFISDFKIHPKQQHIKLERNTYNSKSWLSVGR